MSSLVRTAAPAKPLFTVADLKDCLRISGSTNSDETMLAAYEAAAEEWLEGLAGISIMKQTWTLNADQFPSNRDLSNRSLYGYSAQFPLGKPIKLPRGPVISIDTFSYLDVNGNAVDFKATSPNWQAALGERPPALYPPFGGYFPTAQWVPGALTIVMTCGMSGTADDPKVVDNDVKMAVRFLVAHWWENREPVPVNLNPQKLPYGLEAMIWSTRKGYSFDWQEYYRYSWHRV